jgi:hypothetical protein
MAPARKKSSVKASTSASTESAEKTTEISPRLYCLGGEHGPAGLGADLAVLARLPLEAVQRLWQVLAPSLGDTVSKELEQLLDLFCKTYRLDANELGRTIRACRFVVREAAQRDLTAGALAEDLERLCPRDPLVKQLVLAGYDPAKAYLRLEMLKAAVSDHGKLLVGIRWRLDQVQASERGLKLQMPVALVTLHYREGKDEGRMTLQVLPDMMKELETVCAKVLGQAPPASSAT